MKFKRKMFMEKDMKLISENDVEKLWRKLEKQYCGVFKNLGGRHKDNDLLANALLKDRLSRYENYNEMSDFEVQEIMFFYRMVVEFDMQNCEKFRRFSDVHMKDFKQKLIASLRENDLVGKVMWEELGV